jgi:hypothetical protein
LGTVASNRLVTLSALFCWYATFDASSVPSAFSEVAFPVTVASTVAMPEIGCPTSVPMPARFVTAACSFTLVCPASSSAIGPDAVTSRSGPFSVA